MINFEIFISVSEILKDSKDSKTFCFTDFCCTIDLTESIFCIFIELFTQVEIRII